MGEPQTPLVQWPMAELQEVREAGYLGSVLQILGQLFTHPDPQRRPLLQSAEVDRSVPLNHERETLLLFPLHLVEGLMRTRIVADENFHFAVSALLGFPLAKTVNRLSLIGFDKLPARGGNPPAIAGAAVDAGNGLTIPGPAGAGVAVLPWLPPRL
ncbi:MAG TPA: hypothetical protein VK968_10125 [Roseimicrobium sp.]|nr:hypothetical protein [Roseimicrobium sp.]